MSTIAFRSTGISGLFAVDPAASVDQRGSFTKTFTVERFAEAGLATAFAEHYQTLSLRGTLRGMHFQVPPYDLDKLVYCVAGRVFDVIVDLRIGSPTFRAVQTFDLDGSKNQGLYVPSGCAHGFYVLSDEALMSYAVTGAYAPEADAGILWASVAAPWPSADVVLSERDARWPTIEDFDSPFVYQGDLR
jgi:dTDP-4-dehydrorhamnose 3,5-epimerase